MCPLPRTGGGGGGAFFFTDKLVTPAVLVGGGIVCDSPEWFDTAKTQHRHRTVITREYWVQRITFAAE